MDKVHKLDIEHLNIAEIEPKAFHNEIYHAKGISIVTCTATWCGPCRMMNTSLQNMHDRYLDKDVFECNVYNIYALNVDKCQDSMRAMRVRTIPTQLVFKDGSYIGSMVGAQSSGGLLNAIRDMLKGNK